MSSIYGTALIFFLLALLLGVAMRWDLLSGALAQRGWKLVNLRHAHSHAGYYGVLTLGWWAAALRAGAPLSSRVTKTYALCALLATTGFAFVGYRPVTIVLSTIIASVWLGVGYTHWRRRARPVWLDSAPFGLVFSVLLVPAIAVFAKRDFALSRDLAHVFIASMLLTVFVPAAWQTQGLARRVPLSVYVPLALIASVRIVFAARSTTASALGAIAFSLIVVWTLLTEPLPPRAKLVWMLLPGAIVAGSLVPAVQGYNWRIGGLHLLILGPVMGALFGAGLPAWLRILYSVALLFMVLSIVVPTQIWPQNPVLFTAVGSSLFAGVAAVAAVVAARELRREVSLTHKARAQS